MPLPAGAFPLGLFSFDVVNRPQPPVPILSDYVDETTGEITRLNDGRLPVDGAIIEGLRVERGSGPAVETVGNSLRELRYVEEGLQTEANARAREGLVHLERAGLVRVEQVQVTGGPTSDAIIVEGEIKDRTLPKENPVSSYTVKRGPF